MKTVFCTPYIVTADVQIVANLSSGDLASCKKTGDVIKTYNVTNGGVLNG